MATITTPTKPVAPANQATAAKPAAKRVVQIQPYLFFNGRCDEALEFYRRVLGAEVTTVMRFKDGPPCDESGEHAMPPGWGDKVMHASLRIGATEVLASDGCTEGKPEFRGFSLSLTVATEADAEHLFNSLGDGGEIQMPLAKTFFSPRFGIVADRYGVSWMIYVAP